MLHFTNNGSVTNSGPPVHYRQVRYRLLPGTASKARQLFGLAGAGRFIWNHFLAKHQAAYQLHKENPEHHAKPSISFLSLGKEFTQLRNSGDFPWLQGYSFTIVRAALQSLSLAFQGFFRGKGHPRFKARGRDQPRFTIPDKGKIKGDRLSIPGVGLLRLRRHSGNPYPEGRPVKAAVVHECGKWYATVCYKVDLPPSAEPERVAAMDCNCRQVAVVYSDGTSEIRRQPDTTLLQIKLKRGQRKPGRQQKGSNRRQRTRTRLRKLHRRIRNMANTWRHRLTRHVADKARLLVLEKLNTQAMTRSAQGTVASPGRNVQQKAGLNRSILATGWGEIEQMLGYKTRVVYVNGAYTSQRCSGCGQVDKASRRSQSTFHCTSCGYRANADLNAAQNILASGVGAAARGEAFSPLDLYDRETGPGHSCDSWS